jgi:hypothetical protein
VLEKRLIRQTEKSKTRRTINRAAGFVFSDGPQKLDRHV